MRCSHRKHRECTRKGFARKTGEVCAGIRRRLYPVEAVQVVEDLLPILASYLPQSPLARMIRLYSPKLSDGIRVAKVTADSNQIIA